MTLCPRLWDRRLRASRLPGCAETARFCRPPPALRHQGPRGRRPGPFGHLTSFCCCCLTSFYSEVRSLRRGPRCLCPGLPPLGAPFRPLCPVAVAGAAALMNPAQVSGGSSRATPSESALLAIAAGVCPGILPSLLPVLGLRSLEGVTSGVGYLIQAYE